MTVCSGCGHESLEAFKFCPECGSTVITEVAGNPINSTTDLGNVLHSYKSGDQVQVTWTDQASASHTATITLTTGPAI